MKKKQFLMGFYRALGTGTAVLVGALILIIIALITGSHIDIAGLNITTS